MSQATFQALLMIGTVAAPVGDTGAVVLSNGTANTGENTEYSTGTTYVTWVKNSVAALTIIRVIGYNGTNQYLGVDAAGVGLYASTDGITWSLQAGATNWQTLNRARWNGSLWVGIRFLTQEIWTSPNGTTWTSRTNPVGAGFQSFDIAWAGGTINKWLMVGQGAGYLITSPDGITWTSIASPAVPWDGLMGAAYFNSLAIVMGQHGASSHSRVWTSTDGTTWTNRYDIASLSYPVRPAVGTTSIVALETNDYFVLRSADGLSWTEIATPNPSGGGGMAAITYRRTRYIATFPSGEIYLSTDEGVTWTIAATLAVGTPWSCIT